MTPDTLTISLALVGAALATYAARGLGVAFARRLSVDNPLFQWVSCVAYAMLAGLISRLILLPAGPLAETARVDRVAAAVLALAIFFLTRRNLPLGAAAGVGALVLLTLSRTGLT